MKFDHNTEMPSSGISFQDAFLSTGEIDQLHSTTCWLNGSHINFAFRLIEHHLGLEGSAVLLLDPIVASFLCVYVNEDEEKQELKRGIQFSKREWILSPVNDVSTRLHHGGSHWSLLAFHVTTNRALHFDSSVTRSNTQSALLLSKVLSSLSCQPDAYMENVAAPVQDDGYSCGVFTCLFAHSIASRLARESSFDPFGQNLAWIDDLAINCDQNKVRIWRGKLLDDIENLRHTQKTLDIAKKT